MSNFHPVPAFMFSFHLALNTGSLELNMNSFNSCFKIKKLYFLTFCLYTWEFHIIFCSRFCSGCWAGRRSRWSSFLPDPQLVRLLHSSMASTNSNDDRDKLVYVTFIYLINAQQHIFSYPEQESQFF